LAVHQSGDAFYQSSFKISHTLIRVCHSFELRLERISLL